MKHKLKTIEPLAPPTVPLILLKLDGGYIVARCGQAVQVFELVWESRHGEGKKTLVLRECEEIPRQFEREVYPR